MRILCKNSQRIVNALPLKHTIDVGYGITVTLKNHRAGGAYLHTHHHVYPEEVGPQQQQVGYRQQGQENVGEVNSFFLRRYVRGRIFTIHGFLL